MKRILHISKYYYPFLGGIEQVARDCVLALKDEYEQKIICFNHTDGENVDLVDDVQVYRVKCQTKIASQSIAFSYSKNLKKIINEFKPDLIIFHYPNPYVSHFLLKILKKENIKLIIYWHLDITKQRILGKLFFHQNRKLIKRACKVIATSPNYIDGSMWLKPNKDKCVVIPCCINENRLLVEDKHYNGAVDIKKKFENKIICFAFGRHVKYKGLSYLIKASKFLDDRFVILIGGSGNLTKKLKFEAKNDDKIYFLGRLTDDKLKEYLMSCDIFCFPSITKNEAFGIALAEAMYYSKPVITFNIIGSGVNYVSLNGITGIEVENRNSMKFALAIKNLAENSKYRYTLGENANARVKKLFMFSTYIDNIKHLVKGEIEK